MELNICVIDDDKSVTEQLSAFINNWAIKHSISLNTTIKNDLHEVVPSVIALCDIIFLDVVIGNENGVEFAKKLRSIGCNATIAFISNYNQYAINGYSVHAVSYIIKPLDDKQINSILNYAVFESDAFPSKRIHLSLNGEDRFFICDSILYIEAFRHGTVFHLLDNKESYNYSINSLEKELNKTSFVRCHRSYIINLKYVKRITYTEVQLYNTSTIIPLGRSYINNVKSRLLWEGQYIQDDD